MKKFLSHLRINRTYHFPGTIDELMERLEFLSGNHKRFRTEALGDGNYKVSAKVSIGTVYVTGGLGSPINVRLKVTATESFAPVIHITSKVRPEHYFIAFGFACFFVTTLLIPDKPLYLPFLMIGIFIIAHFWFHLVYRTQEQQLIKKIIGQLKLIEN